MTFDKFISRIPSFELLDKYAKRCSKIGKKELSDITHLPFITLKVEVPAMIEAKEYEKAISIVFGLKLRKVRRASNYRKMQTILWILDEYKKIKLLEEKYLTSPPDGKLVNAGVRDLDVLGHFNLIDMLVEKYGVYTHKQIEQLPYATMFDIQYKMTIERRISKKLSEMKGK